jgi:hypothetical protein
LSKQEPIIIREAKLGLILGPHKSAYCTILINKSDKRQTKLPHNLANKNAGTLSHVRDSGATDPEQLNQRLVMLYGKCMKLYPKWRHINEQLDLTFTQRALEELAQETNQVTRSFTINISPKLGKKVLNQGGASYLNNRLKKELKRKMGRPPSLWLILEAVTRELPTYEGRLHAHGSINLLSSEVGLFSEVMVALNGCNMPSATKLKSITDGDRWVDYCTKYQARNKMFLLNITRVGKSEGLSKRAKQMYEKASADYSSDLKQQRNTHGI